MTDYAELRKIIGAPTESDIAKNLSKRAQVWNFVASLIRERNALRAENERLKAAEIAGREVLLPVKREQAQRFAKEVEKQARAKAIEEAAAIAFARDLSIMSSTAVDIEARKIGNAILALKDKT
jgi:hypothetical protein